MPKAYNSSFAKRFAEKCGPGTDRGCIPWLGRPLNSGYGTIRVGPSKEGTVLAHRAAWEQKHGTIPSGMYVLHGCDNKRCVNVQHLRLGTHQENMADAMERGQHFLSKPAPWTKIPETRIADVFAMRAAGFTQQRIADEFKVSRPLISLLLSGKLKRRSYQAAGVGEEN